MKVTSIDLDQIALRESEQVEWKENVADIGDVVQTLSAFANDLANLGGGYVVCGASERKDEHGFPRLVRTGLNAQQMREIEGKVLQRCRDTVYPAITPYVDELPSDHEDKKLLVFVQPATGSAHAVRTSEDTGKHWVRVGRSTVQARNGVLRELLVRKGALEPWDRRMCAGATVNDLDLLALRDALQRMGVFSNEAGVEAYLSDQTYISAFVPPLCIREPMTAVLRPRNFAMLLFGRHPQRFIPGMVSLFSIYPGKDRSDIYSERRELDGTLIAQARSLHDLLDVQTYTTFDKADVKQPNAVKYPKRALYEAVGNALAHRDYELPDPTRVTVFEDRIEVKSPGSLPYGVNAESFREGKAGARWRNQTLAWFFNRLQLAQAEGQGIPTILRSMKDEGCPPPIFEASEIEVLCILPAHPRYALLRELREVEQDLALGDLAAARQVVDRVLEIDAANIRGLQLFAEIQTALREGGPILEKVKQIGPSFYRLPADLLLQFGEAILASEEITDEQRVTASRLVAAAGAGRLQEREVRRIAIALIRSREQRQALDLIDKYASERPDWQQTASYHQLRGDALTGLANKCRNTARRQGAPPAMRERSWSQFHQYVEEAESHFARAEALGPDPGLAAVIERNREYLQHLKRRSHRRY